MTRASVAAAALAALLLVLLAGSSDARRWSPVRGLRALRWSPRASSTP